VGHLGCSRRRREETEGSVSTRVGDDSRCPDVIVCTLHFIKIASMDCPDVERWLGCRARRICFHQICLSSFALQVSIHGGSRCPGHGNTWAQNLLSLYILMIETFNLHFVKLHWSFVVLHPFQIISHFGFSTLCRDT
jgi:hypothetical protein